MESFYADSAKRRDALTIAGLSITASRASKRYAADRSELGEAIWNIIENALKYAPDAPIHLAARRDNGRSVITVRDEGPGMSESGRVHAFERFYRGDERGEIAGTGLGLAIAKRAVERAGGDIAIDSAPGHGTAVTIAI